ncbi:MAG: hypothetical protein JWM57_3169, partial [Phycisphaerales bacterium]|nr:hypothetical protein [Phycisphaerales bacterium]
RDGKRFGFVGFNYTRMGLGLSVNADYELLAHDVMQMQRWGTRAVRMTVDMGLTQPEPGVFPDSPRYAELMKKHNLDPRYMDQVDYFIRLAGEQDIYTVLDWHGMPCDPYRYFLGGKPSDRDTGKPGTAIAYLAKSPTEQGEFNPTDPKHQAIMISCHTWLAQHYKGNPNVLGIEIPYNEPHTTEMAVEANWRHVVDLAAKAIAAGDPDRMTFIMAPSYGHNNLLPSVTWMPPDRATGGAPHFYQANGPVPTRPDAKSTASPWLARDVEATLGWSFPAVVMPFSAVNYPFYNGEVGKYGHEVLLNKIEGQKAAEIMVEAGLVQEYAVGMVGGLEWTLWGDNGDFNPYTEIYARQMKRFSPVYEAGPVDRQKAEIAFVQNSEAVPSGNGHNFACVPLAKAVLDLHLPPVHYLTDDQFRYTTSAELSVGLEQVVETAGGINYKAIIADRRKLDAKVEATLKGLKIPVLFIDDAAQLTAEKLAAFLKTAKVSYDDKTPKQIQLIEGPEHLVVYRRLDGGTTPTKIYPQLQKTGVVTLTDESGKVVFTGDAKALATQGLSVDLPVWTSAIYKIESK